MSSSPATLLERLVDLGATVSVIGDRLHIEAPVALPDDLVAALRAHKPALLPLVRLVPGYREALGEWWRLCALEAEADPETCRTVLDTTARLTDDLGAELALRLRHQWAREWWAEHRVCPYCGEHGPYHDPATGEATS